MVELENEPCAVCDIRPATHIADVTSFERTVDELPVCDDCSTDLYDIVETNVYYQIPVEECSREVLHEIAQIIADEIHGEFGEYEPTDYRGSTWEIHLETVEYRMDQLEQVLIELRRR